MNQQQIVHKRSGSGRSRAIRSPRRLLRGAILLLLVAIALSGCGSAKPSGKLSEAEAYPFPYDTQPSLGDANAPVKIVEFGDFKCLPCKQVHDYVVPLLKKDYIDKGIVQFYFMNDTVIDGSETAAMAGESIYHQNPFAFWLYYDALYKNQQDESSDWATVDFLINFVKTNKILPDTAQLKDDLESSAYLKDVEQDTLLAERLGVTGAPAFFINGKLFTGNDYDTMKKTIETVRNQ